MHNLHKIEVQCSVRDCISQHYARTALFDDVAKLLHSRNTMAEARLAMDVQRYTPATIMGQITLLRQEVVRSRKCHYIVFLGTDNNKLDNLAQH